MLVFPLDKEIAGNCLLYPRVIGELVLVGCGGSIVGRFRVLRLYSAASLHTSQEVDERLWCAMGPL